MQKILTTLIFFLMTSFVATSMYASIWPCFELCDPRLYATLKGGCSGGYEVECDKIKTHLGYFVAGSVGYRIFSPFRVEGEIMYQTAPVRSLASSVFFVKNVHGHVRTYSFIANGILDFNCDFPVRPYIGTGFGYGQVRGNWSGKHARFDGIFYRTTTRWTSEVKKYGLAWQVLAGLRYSVFDELEVNLEYKFFKLVSAVSNHNLGLSCTKFF